MKKMKKILALFLALVTVLGMSVTAFADEAAPTTATKPASTDTQTATVNNVEAGATVTAYQIVKGEYNTNGFVQYVKADDDLSIADVTAQTSDEVTTIATAINNGTLTLTSKKMNQGTTENGFASYTANLEAGYWIVLVDSESVDEVYNPMLVGVYYSVSGSDNTMVSGAVDADSNWTLVTTNAYAKSTKPEIEKTIVNPGSQNGKGDDVGIGDTVNYQIATAIPSYSKEYSKVIVKISDTLSEGLTLNEESVVVKSGETTLTAGTLKEGSQYEVENGQYAVTSKAQGFEVTIDSNWALAHGKANITVTYSATLNENAGINFDPNTNTATLTYSNNPKNENDTETVTDITYHYTFGLDAKLYGSSTEEWNKTTEEIWKTEKVTTETESGSTTTTSALAGAEFTLYTDEACTTIYKNKTATSGADGSLNFEGLDAGTYYLKETKAPSGYTINSAVIPVVITATYNENGTLASYTVKIDGKYTNTYTATYASTTETSVKQNVTKIDHTAGGNANDGTSKDGQMPILNTKISTLPSTGGIGTTIFTIAGCAIMIAAAGFFFANRKKRA